VKTEMYQLKLPLLKTCSVYCYIFMLVSMACSVSGILIHRITWCTEDLLHAYIWNITAD